MIGPAVLMVSVVVATVPFTMTGCGLNEQTGGSVTNGVIEEHERVTLPV